MCSLKVILAVIIFIHENNAFGIIDDLPKRDVQECGLISGNHPRQYTAIMEKKCVDMSNVPNYPECVCLEANMNFSPFTESGFSANFTCLEKCGVVKVTFTLGISNNYPSNGILRTKILDMETKCACERNMFSHRPPYRVWQNSI